MATINIGYRLFADNEEEARNLGIPRLTILCNKIIKALEIVEKDCFLRFPELNFEVSDFEPEYISLDETDDVDGQILWDFSYWIEVKTTSGDGIPECDYSFDAYDQWYKTGKPMYKDVCEPLYDWSAIESFCGATADTMGEIVSVEFEAMKAVDSYYDGIHFYSHHRWL
jgi:hypothetical protein